MNNSPLAAVGISILMLLLVIVPGVIFRACDSNNPPKRETLRKVKKKPMCKCKEVHTLDRDRAHDDSVMAYITSRLKPGQKVRVRLDTSVQTGRHHYFTVTFFVDRDSCIGTVTERIEIE